MLLKDLQLEIHSTDTWAAMVALVFGIAVNPVRVPLASVVPGVL